MSVQTIVLDEGLNCCNTAKECGHIAVHTDNREFDEIMVELRSYLNTGSYQVKIHEVQSSVQGCDDTQLKDPVAIATRGSLPTKLFLQQLRNEFPLVEVMTFGQPGDSEAQCAARIRAFS